MKNIEKFNNYYIESILEKAGNGELELVLTDELRELLKTIDHTIAKKLINSERKSDEYHKITLIGIDQSIENFNKFFVTQSSKIIDYFDKLGYKSNVDVISSSIQSTIPNELQTKYRTPILIGKVINKLFPDEFKNAGDKGNDVESFVDAVKSERGKTYGEFKILEGEDVVEYYLKDSYESNGYGSTLYGSCMNKEKCSPYIEFYEENNIKMVVLMSSTEPNKIKGRAILWNIDEIDEVELDEPRIFMDRIYTIKSHDTEKFIEYAKTNKWLYKANQNMKATEQICDTVTNKCEILYIKSYNIGESTAYPYMDTMKYLNMDYDFITNDSSNSDSYDFALESTHGGYSTKYGDEYVYMDSHSDIANTNELFYDDNTDEYVDLDDTVFSEYNGERATRDYADENWVYSELEDDYIPSECAYYLSFLEDNVTDDYARENYYESGYEDKFYESDDDLVESDKYTYVPKDKAVTVYLDKSKTKSDIYFKGDGKYFELKEKNGDIVCYDNSITKNISKNRKGELTDYTSTENEKETTVTVITDLETNKTVDMDVEEDKDKYFEYNGKYYDNKLKDKVTGQLRIWEKRIQRFNGKY